MSPVRVLLVDDHTLFRSGVKALLQRHDEFEVVGESADSLEGVKRARELKPDVVLLDLHMPGVSGKDAVKLFLEQSPDTRVVMLTVSEAADDLVDTLRAGASGYLLKNIETETLLDSIRRAVAGDSVVSAEMTTKLVKGLRATGSGSDPGTDKEALSPREHEILGYVAKGASNKEIARALDLAESTVKIHVQHILRKLNLSSRVQAAVYAIEHGLASS
ncbi:MAG: XRE family transcriptional regulator [Betaproteobacteria bacterium SG8_40]|nr:MAG: XRE family transcriptional regulator [Betaproteobacteria bacterium SG8_40]